MDGLDPRSLLVLKTVLEERHVTRAAARLGLAQPAASAALARLRRRLGDPLLVRGARGMVLTERAEAALPRVRLILDELARLVEPGPAFDPAARGFDAAVAAADYLQATLLAAALDRVAREAPAARVSLRAMEPGPLAERLERGQLDLALMPRGNAPAHLRSRVVGEERFVCLARPGHPALAGGLDLDAFCRCDHVLASPTSGDFRGQVDRALDALGRGRRVTASASSFLAAAEIVRRSDRLATVPERLARALAPALEVHEPPLAVEGFTLALIWHERVDAAPAHRWLRELIAGAA